MATSPANWVFITKLFPSEFTMVPVKRSPFLSTTWSATAMELRLITAKTTKRFAMRTSSSSKSCDEALLIRSNIRLHIVDNYETRAIGLVTSLEQNAQRRAPMGISLRHSGHLRVVGSAGTGSPRMRAIRALTGRTTKK